MTSRDLAALKKVQQGLTHDGMSNLHDMLGMSLLGAFPRWQKAIGPAVAISIVTSQKRDHPPPVHGLLVMHGIYFIVKAFYYSENASYGTPGETSSVQHVSGLTTLCSSMC